MDMQQVLHAVVLLAMAGVVGILGVWGRRHAAVLVPHHFEPEDRERRARSLRRGALSCYAAAAVLLGAAVLALI